MKMHKPIRLQRNAFAVSILQAIPLAVALQSVSSPALASCASSADGVVTCSGPAPLLNPGFSSSADNLTVNVDPTGQLGTLLGLGLVDPTALSLTGNNATLNNAGVIDPSLLRVASVLTSGAVIGNTASGSTLTVNNGSTGKLFGAIGLLEVSLSDLTGMALEARNGAGGTTTIVNDGLISSASIVGVTVPAPDSPVIAAHGGANVNMINGATGLIIGRIAFEGAATGGNTLINAGTINGSVSLGHSDDAFTAVTGSSVNAGDGIALDILGVVGLNLGFAATGTVDAGAGIDRLVLQNALDTPGSGLAGTGTAAADVYRNFENLTVNSGTWTINGGLVSGNSTLNGGLAIFDAANSFGGGTITGNGGAIQAALGGLNLGNQIDLLSGGLGIQGVNDLTLSGVISGVGGLLKSGTGTLTLTGANAYAGPTLFDAGRITVGTDTALGTGTLVVRGPGALNASAEVTLGNAVDLGADLTIDGGNNLGLNGAISGSGGLTKNGTGLLGLGGANSFTGGVTLNTGGLVVGHSSALGTGALTVAGAATSVRANAAGVTLGNAVNLDASLVADGNTDFGLSGVISGVGGLIKAGDNTLSLSGANTFSGGVVLDAGGIAVGNNTALGTGALTVAGLGTLGASAPLATLGNAVDLEADLSIVGANSLGLNGVISGNGGLTKNGPGVLGLGGANSFTGGVTINAGSIVVGNSSALGTGALTVAGAGAALAANAAAVTLDNAVGLDAGLLIAGDTSFGLSGVISGIGRLTKIGTGTLTLDGANSFGGGVVLSAGSLDLGTDTALGTGVLTVIGQGVLDANAARDLDNVVNIAADAQLTIAGSNALTLSGQLVGRGVLRKLGDAQLTLAGDMDFVGTLAVDAGVVNVIDTIVAGISTGAGGTANFGVGHDILTAAGPIAGTLNLGAGSDDINASFADLRDITGRIDGQTGADTLHINGSGEARLPTTSFLNFEDLFIGAGGTLIIDSGSRAQFSGATRVDGILVLDGILDGQAVIATGAALVGGGSLTGPLTLKTGLLAPSGVLGASGAAAGTGAPGVQLTSGSLATSPGVGFQVRANAAGVSDSLRVNGTARIGGGDVSALLQPGDFAPVTDYTIIDTTQGVFGTFDTVTDNLPFLSASVLTQGDDMILRVQQDLDGQSLRFEEFPNLTADQRSVATALQAAADEGKQLTAQVASVRGLANEQVAQTFDSLTGETYASMLSAMVYGDSQYRDSVLTRMNQARQSCGLEATDDARVRNLLAQGQCGSATSFTAWASTYYGDADFDGGGDLANVAFHGRRLTLGFDVGVGSAWQMGVHSGINDGLTTVDRRSDRTNSDQHYFGVHTSFSSGIFWLQGTLDYGQIDAETTRGIVAGSTLQPTARASFDGESTLGAFEAGWRFDLRRSTLEPLVGLYYSRLSIGSFTERGAGDANLIVNGLDQQTLAAGVGARWRGFIGIDHGSSRIYPTLDVRYLHNVSDRNSQIVNAFVDAPDVTFAVSGVETNNSTWLVGLGSTWVITDRASMSLKYDLDLGDNSNSNADAASLGLRVNW